MNSQLNVQSLKDGLIGFDLGKLPENELNTIVLGLMPAMARIDLPFYCKVIEHDLLHVNNGVR